MKCAAYRRWLDAGRPQNAAAAAAEHASGCRGCAALRRADEAIDRLLAEPLAPAPRGFTERLMVRLPAGPSTPLPLALPETPWWLRAALDPAAMLALALAGLISWRSHTVLSAGLAAAGVCSRWVAHLSGSASPAGGAFAGSSRPEAQLGLEMALACVLLLAAPALTRLGLRAANRLVATS